MGKWSQYKRRGSAQQGSSPSLAPPPAPSLLLIGSEVTQRHSGLVDSGGTCRLYSSQDAQLWAFLPPEVEWAPDVDWGYGDGYTGLFLRCTEVGNDVAYTGESIPSNVLDLT